MATADDSLYVIARRSLSGGNYLEKMTPCGGVRAIGTGVVGPTSPDDTKIELATIGTLSGLRSGPDGSFYFFDSTGIRRIGPEGVFSTVLLAPGINRFKFSPQGQLFFVDSTNRRIRKLEEDGTVQTVAGNGTANIDFVSLRRGLPAGGSIPEIADFEFLPDNSIVMVNGPWHTPGGGRLYKITSPLPGFTGGQTVVADAGSPNLHVFDANGRHVRTQDRLTQTIVSTFTYTANGRIESITDRNGLTTTIERDSFSFPSAIVAPGGQRTTLTTDSNGYINSISDPGGNVNRFTFRSDGLLTSMQDPNGNTSVMTYDAAGRLQRDTDAVGGFSAFSRVGNGRNFVVTQETAEGRTTTYDVSVPTAYGNFQQTITGPTGSVATSAHDPNGRSITTRDGITQTVEMGPDPRFGFQVPLAKLKTVLLPSGLQNTVTRTKAVTTNATTGALVTQTTNSTVNGRTFRTVFNATTRTTTTESPGGRTTTNVVDVAGRPVFRQVGTLAETEYLYDSRGRIASVAMGTAPAARNVSFEYDAKDRLISLTDPLGRIHAITHDEADRPSVGTSPALNTVSFGYDPTGNVLSISPPGRPAHLTTYSPINLQTAYSPPAAGPGAWNTTWGYNLDKQVVSTTRPNGITLSNSYDLAGRITQIAHPNGVRTFEYNGTRRVLLRSGSEDGVTTTYMHDGMLPLSTTWSGPISGTVQRQFDANFRVTNETVNGAHGVTFSYDQDGLLTDAGEHSFYLDQNGQAYRTVTSGMVVEDRIFNEFGERSEDQHVSYAGGYAILLANTYERDALGRIIRKSELSAGVPRVLEYEYDLDGRLREVKTDSVVTATYSYDSNGNRLSVWRPGGGESGTYDLQDRLVTYGQWQYEYDRNGELLTKTDTTNGATEVPPVHQTASLDIMPQVRADWNARIGWG